MKIRKFLLISGAVTAIPISCTLAVNTDDIDSVNDNTGLEFMQAFVTMSDTGTSATISTSVAGVAWISPYTAENLPLATILPGDILRAESGYYIVVNKKV